jgi:hypothetical protein
MDQSSEWGCEPSVDNGLRLLVVLDQVQLRGRHLKGGGRLESRLSCECRMNLDLTSTKWSL